MQVRATITIETTTLVVVRNRSPHRAWCPGCAGEREMVALGDINGLPSVGRQSVERWLEGSRLHLIRGRDGVLLICLPSLLAAAGQSEPGNVVTTLPAITSCQRLAKADDKERS
jgi:hypothetical protein